jgi:hypothetical protein
MNNIEVEHNDLVLLTQYYEDKDCPMREAENDLALKRNISNPAFKKIILFVEEDITIPFNSDKIEVVHINDRLTYKHVVEYMRGKPGVKLLANSDIYFESDISRIVGANFDKRMFSINRVNLNPDNGTLEPCNLSLAKWSSDAWIWRELPEFMCDIYLGVNFCENLFLINAEEAGV